MLRSEANHGLVSGQFFNISGYIQMRAPLEFQSDVARCSAIQAIRGDCVRRAKPRKTQTAQPASCSYLVCAPYVVLTPQ
jgi:hypothetical protein